MEHHERAQLGESNAAQPIRPKTPGPKGIDGWLAWFVVTQVGGIFRITYSFYSVLSFYADHQNTYGGLDATLNLDIKIASLLEAIVIIGTVVGLFLVLSRSSNTPRFWTAFLPFAMLLSLVNVFLFRDFASRASRYALSYMGPPSFLAVLFGIALYLVWTLYWLESERVQNTYGYAGFKRVQFPSGGLRSELAKELLYPLAVVTVSILLLLILAFFAERNGASRQFTSPTL